jgi:ubiquinone/menaquinone biosynthesis C-methylase UbiE
MEDYLKINEAAYDETAEEYRKRISWYEESDKEILFPFIRLLKEKFEFEKANLLELGPGSGLALRFFEEAGMKTTAIDISSKIIEVARKTSPNTSFIKSDFLEYDFKKEKFDGIFAKAFIHLFPKKDAEKVFRKVYSLLSEDGLFYLTTTIHDKSWEGFVQKEDYSKKSLRFRKEWTEKELIEEVNKNGFKIIEKVYKGEIRHDKNWIILILSKR